MSIRKPAYPTKDLDPQMQVFLEKVRRSLDEPGSITTTVSSVEETVTGVDFDESDFTLSILDDVLQVSLASGTIPAPSDLGDTLYGDGSGWAVLPGNTTILRKFLSQTGDGAASAAPVWARPLFSDLPGKLPYSQLPDGGGVWANAGDLALTGGSLTLDAGEVLNWSSDNAAGSFIGTSATEGRPKAGYFGEYVTIGAPTALTGITYTQPGLFVRTPGGTAGGATIIGDFAVVKFGNAPIVLGFRVNGTEGAESGVLSGESILNVTSGGWTSAGTATTGVALLYFAADENFTGTARGTKMGLSVTQLGTLSRRDTFITRASGTDLEAWGAFTTATALATTRQDALFLRDRASAAGSGNFGQGLAFSRLSDATPRRMAAITTRQTTADADQIGLSFFVHDSATDTTAMSEILRLSLSGDLHSQFFGDITAIGGIFTGDITTSADAITLGFGITTANVDAILTINAGDNAGGLDTDSYIAHTMGGSSRWLVGVRGVPATVPGWSVYDDVNNVAAITVNAGAAPTTQFGGGIFAVAGTFTGLIQTTLTTQQLSLQYDASNHLAVTVSSAGAVTYNATGASASHIFSDLVSTDDDFVVTTDGKGLRADTADASDNQAVYVAGGGGYSTARGSFLKLSGNEYVAGAEAVLSSGATGNVILQVNGATRLTIADTSTTVGSGTLITAASVAGRAGFRLPSGTAPSSPTSGDYWYDGTNLKFQDGGTTRTITWT